MNTNKAMVLKNEQIYLTHQNSDPCKHVFCWNPNGCRQWTFNTTNNTVLSIMEQFTQRKRISN